jgi:hypothetical protein
MEIDGLWFWGDWYISRVVRADLIGLPDPKPYGYWLIVSSGVKYGPFSTLDAAKQHAEDVRGD